MDKKWQKWLIFICVIAIIALVIVISPNGFLTQRKFQLQRVSKKAFYFAQNQTADVSGSTQAHITLPLRFFKQEHSVSCEVAALRTSLDFLGIKVSEDELIDNLVFSARGPRSEDNIWGDPDVGFVGDINGSIFLGTGYGVYDEPIKDLALKYTGAFVMKDATLDKVLKETQNGRPVIVWGLLSNRKRIYWNTEDGKVVEAFPGEHARVVMGYTGDISDIEKIILMDPIYGRIFMDKDKFMEDWGTLDRRAVVVFNIPETRSEYDIIVESLREKILTLQNRIFRFESMRSQ